MKITICGSMAFAKEMFEIKKQLENKGHEIIFPYNTEFYADGSLAPESRKESVENKIKHDLFKYYFKQIQDSDAILVVNLSKNNIDNYVGGNSFIEMAFAHVLDKKVFLLNPIPQIAYSDEIIGLQPIIINGNLDKIV
ncbi:MAG: hypothetical protein ACQER9_01805 [Nanobdellota archaeon]